MLSVRIIPCLDVRDGRVVKGVRFQGLRDVGGPVELARAYEKQGADEIVLLDVSATPEGRATAIDTVRSVRAELAIPLTVGGGVRTAKDAGTLLEAGADKISINTAAVDRPELIEEIASTYGAQCAVVAIDAARHRDRSSEIDSGYEIVTLSGGRRTGIDVVDWARKSVSYGAGEILLTSFDRDGTRSGYDLDLLSAVASAVSVPVIASGGVASLEHFLAGLGAGADAVLAASIFHDGHTTVTAVKQFLMKHGVRIRP